MLTFSSHFQFREYFIRECYPGCSPGHNENVSKPGKINVKNKLRSGREGP
jgi:hypothetical protein